MKTFVYVDGFNLYYGALKGTPHKWLDLAALSRQIVPSYHSISKIKYFTARVSGARDPDAPRRQQIYFSALRTFPEIEIWLGSFLTKTIWRPILNLPVANQQISTPTHVVLPDGTHTVNSTTPQSLVVANYPMKGSKRAKAKQQPLANSVLAEVHTMEEKGSDVNLAAHLLNDAWLGVYDTAVVISNDTDLVEPIRMVTQERKKDVTIVCPGRWQAAPKLTQVATSQRHIRPAMLAAAQLANPIPGTSILKPAGW